jgi:3-oxoacyl-[acyl-carrier-protein] synthase III
MAIHKKFALSGAKAVKIETPLGIVAVGSYLPPTILKNEDFVNVDLSKDGQKFMKEYFGFDERRYAGDETFTDMSIKAARDALKNYSIDPKELDLVISAHCSVDMERMAKPDANKIQTEIGAVNATSFNVKGGFNSLTNSLATAAAFIASGFYDTVLIVSSETSIRELDCSDMKALFMGDGASAFVLKRLKKGESGLLAFHLMARECEKAASLKMSGALGNYNNKHFELRPFVYVEPISFPRDIPFLEKYVPYSIEQSLTAAGMTVKDVNLFIFGQQFLDLNKKWAYNLGVSYEKVHDTLAKTACLKNPNIPFITHDALKVGKLKKGDIVAIGDQGANWSIGSAVLKWCI